MDGSLWTWTLDIGFLRTRTLVFLRIPSFALGYHSSCDGSKALAGKLDFRFSRIWISTVFQDQDLRIRILDFATNILVGSGLFGASISKILRLRLSVFWSRVSC